jgi:uncharacterized RDD family membrane protein YckC
MKDRLKAASLSKRILAWVIDAALVFASFLALYLTVGSSNVMPMLGGTAIYDEVMDIYDASGLYRVSRDEEGSPTGYGIYAYAATAADSAAPTESEDGYAQTGNGYELYYDIVYDFYTDFLVSDDRISPVEVDGESVPASEYYGKSYFNRKVLLLPDPASITDVTDEKELAGDNLYFKYDLTDDGTAADPEKKPVLREEYATKVAEGDSTALSNLLAYFYSTDSDSNSSSGLYVTALGVLNGTEYLTSRSAAYSGAGWATMAICYMPGLVLFAFLIPLCLKNGQSLGKLMTRCAVLTDEGYSVGPYQRIMRPFVVTVFSAAPIYYSSTMLCLIIGFAILVVDFIFMMTDKSGESRALHDRIAKTMVVDAKESLWFASPEAEEQYMLENPDAPVPGSDSTISPEEEARISREDSVLDLSNINRNREAAARMTSFDEYENEGVVPDQTLEPEDNPETDAAIMSLAESFRKEKGEPAPKKEGKKEEPKHEVTPPNEDGFTDDSEEKK